MDDHNKTHDHDVFMREWVDMIKVAARPIGLTPEQPSANDRVVQSILTRSLASVATAPKPSPEKVKAFLADCERVMADARRCAAQTYHRSWWQRLCSHLRG